MKLHVGSHSYRPYRHGHAGQLPGARAGHDQATKRALIAALGLTAAFMGVEAAVGFIGKSLALLADAGHMLADTGALALALLAQHWSSKPRTERSTYGFQRAEVLAAFLNGAVLAVTAAFILKEALHRWATPQLVWGKGVVITAAAGLAVNLAAAGILSRAKGRSLNVRAAFAHLIADSLGSVAAISAGLAVLLFGAYRADPALSALIALLIAFSGWRVLKETTAILLEAAPPHLDVAAIERTILDSPGVVDLHDLHVWRISDRFDALTVHITLERGKHGIEVCHTVTERLRKEHGLYHVTVQPEAPPPDEVVHVRSRRDGGPIGKVG